MKGKESDVKVCRFGEKVQWKPLAVRANRRTPIEVRWEDGYWLGLIFRTDESLIGTDKGVVRCRDFRRLSEEKQYDAEGLLSVCGTPQRPVPTRNIRYVPTSIAREANEEEGDVEDVQEVAADVDVRVEPVQDIRARAADEEFQSMRILKRDVLQYGATIGCKASEMQMKGIEGRKKSKSL